MMYKSIKFFGITALLLLPLWVGAQQPQEDEAKELKDLYVAIEEQVDNYTNQLDLEVWQTFYLDSILTHDYMAMRDELKGLRDAKMTNVDLYQTVRDKWNEQIYNSLEKVFNDPYLSGTCLFHEVAMPKL